MIWVCVGIYLTITVLAYLFCRQIHKDGFTAAKWTQKDRVIALAIGLCPILNIGFVLLMIGIWISDVMDDYPFWDKEAKW